MVPPAEAENWICDSECCRVGGDWLKVEASRLEKSGPAGQPREGELLWVQVDKASQWWSLLSWRRSRCK